MLSENSKVMIMSKETAAAPEMVKVDRNGTLITVEAHGRVRSLVADAARGIAQDDEVLIVRIMDLDAPDPGYVTAMITQVLNGPFTLGDYHFVQTKQLVLDAPS